VTVPVADIISRSAFLLCTQQMVRDRPDNSFATENDADGVMGGWVRRLVRGKELRGRRRVLSTPLLLLLLLLLSAFLTIYYREFRYDVVIIIIIITIGSILLVTFLSLLLRLST